MTIHVVPSESLTAVCVDCGNGLFGGPPCEHKIKRAAEREAARMTGEQPLRGREGMCGKCGQPSTGVRPRPSQGAYLCGLCDDGRRP